MKVFNGFGKQMMPTQRVHWLVLMLVLMGAMLSYSLALQAELFFDDLPSLTHNLPLHINGQSFDAWRTAVFSSDAGPLHRPVAMLSFAANHALFGGFSPASLRLINLAIHFVIAVLIYALALAILRAPAMRPASADKIKVTAFVTAAIWLLHPLHVSTVLYVVQRMAQLSTLFSVLGLWLFLRYRLRWAERGATTGELLAAGLWLALITAVATLSKENGALIPWLIAAVEVTLFRGCWNKKQSFALLWFGWAALLAPLVLMLFILFISPEIFTAGYQLRDYTMLERLFTEARILWRYLSWLLLPDITAMGFHHDDIKISQSLLQPLTTLLAVLAWATVLIAAFMLRRRYPLLLFSVLFFLIAHVMESSVLALELVFEHRNYLPSIAVCLLFAQLLCFSVYRGSNVRGWLPLGGVLAVLFLLLFFRAQSWSSQLSLAYSNVLNHPSSARAHYFYADSLFESYRARQAEGLDKSDGGKKSKAIMVATRHHFLRMHEELPNSAIAIVKLLTIDSYFFPGLVKQNDWMGVLETALNTRVPQASDFGAMSLLVECVSTGGCEVEFSRVGALLDKMIVKNPREVWLLLSKYQLQLAAGGSPEERLQTLEKAAAVSPRHPSVHDYSMREKRQLGNVAAVYEVVRLWLAHDTKRRDLPTIMRLFTVPEQAAVPAEGIEPHRDSEI